VLILITSNILKYSYPANKPSGFLKPGRFAGEGTPANYHSALFYLLPLLVLSPTKMETMKVVRKMEKEKE